MEVTCSRCHQAILADSCFCPTCGLPQLVYSSDAESVPAASERWPEPARDASSIDWKAGMRTVMSLAVPAGLLSSAVSPLGVLRVFWMLGASVAAVVLYMRSQKPRSITIGAGARIGLVTGLIAAWLAFGVSAAGLFIERVGLHQGDQIDSAWRDNINASQQLTQQWLTQMNVPSDAAQANAQRNWMLSPEGHAGFETGTLLWSCFLLVLFGAGGGALGARLLSRSRRPEI
jgi:hypothetical protein